MLLRIVEPSDIEFLLALVNDSDVRSNSFNSEIIKNLEHQSWYLQKQSDSNCYMYIAEVDGVSIGQVRLDCEKNVGRITYSVSPVHRNLGYGTRILIEVVEYWCRHVFGVLRLYGQVKKENIASQKAFINANFIENDRYPDYNEYWYPTLPIGDNCV